METRLQYPSTTLLFVSAPISRNILGFLPRGEETTFSSTKEGRVCADQKIDRYHRYNIRYILFSQI